MKVVNHPYLAGVKCREDGACFVPAIRGGLARGPHWTFGSKTSNGYREVCIARKHYLVHRLMAEAFLQCPIPAGMQIDHIDRDKSLNALFNLRIVTPSVNNRNKSTCIKGMENAVSQLVDRNAYRRTRYALDPEFREKQKARARAYYAKKKAGKEAKHE